MASQVGRGRAATSLVVLTVSVMLVSSACISPEDGAKQELKVIYAGSLIVPFGDLEQAYERTHPDVDVVMEGHGSIQSIRHITDVHEEFDVVAVADDSLIPAMMYPEYADWYVRFADNQMVLMYRDTSLYADEITETNWYEILARPGVTFGFSNPMFDACGYRTLTLIPLAERYYEEAGLFEELIGGHFEPEVELREDADGGYTVLIPEIFEPQGAKIAVRGGSVQLLALLDFGGIDYAFGYKSVALQHGLQYVALPQEIDLSSAAYSDFYGEVTVNLGFQRFESVEIDRVGTPIFYGITVPKNAPNPDLGLSFVAFVLSDEGTHVLEGAYQPTITPEADSRERLPEELSAVVTKEIAE